MFRPLKITSFYLLSQSKIAHVYFVSYIRCYLKIQWHMLRCGWKKIPYCTISVLYCIMQCKVLTTMCVLPISVAEIIFYPNIVPLCVLFFSNRTSCFLMATTLYHFLINHQNKKWECRILDNLPVAVLRQRRDGGPSTTYEHGFRVGFKGNYAGVSSICNFLG